MIEYGIPFGGGHSVRWFAAFLAVCCLLFTGCAAAQNADDDDSWEVDTGVLAPDPHYQARVLMRRMSLNDKIYQMMFLCPEDLTGEEYTTCWPEDGVLGSRPVGGILLFGQNIVSAEQLEGFAADILRDAENAPYPPFLAVEEEGGAYSRVANKVGLPTQPSPAQLGRNGGTEAAYASGKAIGEYLNRFHINLDLAPDADVLSEPNNELGDRCFGNDWITVSRMAAAFAEGLNDSGVAACYKHFPGQGSATGALYKGKARNNVTLEEMMRSDLLPFYDGINGGVPMIMVSHMKAGRLDDAHPASLSYSVMTELLRDSMGFQGVIVTDSLRGKGIRDEKSAGDLAVECILAGADMIVLPQNAEDAVQGILNAVQKGTVTEERINESVERILIMKVGMGLIQ